MRGLSLLLSIVSVNLRSLPERPTNAIVMILSIAGVVAVFSGALAMSAGLNGAMRDAGRQDRAVVLRSGSTAEITSAITRDQVKQLEGIGGIKTDDKGRPLFVGEAVASLTLVEKGTHAEVNGTLRGVGPAFFAVRPEIRIVRGRANEPGKNEIIVGQEALRQFAGLELGGKLDAYRTQWDIVGVFSADRSFRESELVTDAEVLMNVSGRPAFQNVTAVLQSPATFESFKRVISSNPGFSMEVFREPEFLSRESSSLNRLLAFMAYVMGGIMALGATFVALNATYSSINDRRREVATLRALGFAPAIVMCSIVIEALLLSLVGGTVGAMLAWLAFNDKSMSTAVGADVHQLVFNIAVTLPVIANGLLGALVIGIIGALPPAARTLSRPVADDLRAI
jgi:putative ABC transport system permease protein